MAKQKLTNICCQNPKCEMHSPIWILNINALPCFKQERSNLSSKERSNPNSKPESKSECFALLVETRELPPPRRSCGPRHHFISKKKMIQLWKKEIFSHNFFAPHPHCFFMFFVFFSLFSLQHQLLKPTECIFLWKEIQFLFISSPSNFIIYFGLERTYLVITMSGNFKQWTIIILSFFEQKSEIIVFPAEYLCCAEKFLQPYIIFQNGRGLDLKTQQYISHSQFHSPDIKTFHKSAFCFPR